MVYVYLLESVHQRDQHYVGSTHDLEQRVTDHNKGKSAHTRKFKPWHLVVYFGFADEPAAMDFERYLKSGSGKTFLKRHFLRTRTSKPNPCATVVPQAHPKSPRCYDGLARQRI